MMLNFGRQLPFPHSHPLSCSGGAPDAIIEDSLLLRLAKEIIH